MSGTGHPLNMALPLGKLCTPGRWRRRSSGTTFTEANDGVCELAEKAPWWDSRVPFHTRPFTYSR